MIFFLAFFIIGMIILLFTFNAIRRSKQSLNWPTTDGEIINSKIDISKGINTGLEIYNPCINYRYKVQDKEYTSSRIYFGSQLGASYKEDKIKTLFSKYQTAQKIQVSYDPNNHQLSVIEPGYHSELSFGIIAGILLIIISFIFVKL
jgi:hypothetical protein